MTSPTARAAAVLLALTLAACGGASKRTTTPPATTTPTAPAAGPSPTATQAPAPQPSGGAAPSPPAAHANVPALFTVTAGGAVRPPTVSVPAAVPVELTVVSGDGHAHTAVLRSPAPRTLKVPAGGRASVLISGLRPGTYTVELDGANRGSLVIGAQPGP